MRHALLKHVLLAVGFLLAASVIGLWSWNTLAALFDWPVAEFRHLLAAIALIALLRFSLRARRPGAGHAMFHRDTDAS